MPFLYKTLYTLLIAAMLLPGSLIASSRTLAPETLLGSDPSGLEESVLREYLRRGGEVPQKLSVIVPVYRELDNGNLFRLLESFANQGLPSKNFRLIFVVNNTPEVAADPENPIRVENRRTLAVLNALADPSLSIPSFVYRLDPPIRDKIVELKRTIARTGMRIGVLDHSTRGIEKNIGNIRHLGYQYALQNANVSPDRHVIAMMDADAVVPSEYVENLLVLYFTRPLKSVFVGMLFKIWEGFNLEHLQTFFREKTLNVGYFMNQALTRNYNFPLIGSPQITALASAIDEAGGIPKIVRYEDVSLATNLIRLGGNRWDFSTLVLASERAREDSFAGNFAWKKLNGKIKKNPRNKAFDDPLVLLVQDTLKRLYGSRVEDARLEDLAAHFTYYGIPFDRDLWQAGLKSAEEERSNRFIQNLFKTYFSASDLVSMWTRTPGRVLYSFLMKKLPPEESLRLRRLMVGESFRLENERRKLRELAERIFWRGKIGLPLVSPEDGEAVREFFRLNAWIVPEIERLIERHDTPEEALGELERLLPDWFLPLGQTPYKIEYVTSYILVRFLMDVHNNPQEFPGARRILGYDKNRFPFQEEPVLPRREPALAVAA